MDFKNRIKKLPRSPGVYLLKDAADRVLYIGKAKSLRDRVSNYLRADQVSPKIAAMIPKIRNVDYLETESEVEALLAEQRLVKDINPKYNTNLKDDKSYPSLEISLGDDFPAARFVRARRSSNSENIYYGPFTDATALRRAIKVLQKIFRFRTCNLRIKKGDRSRRYARPCLLNYIDCCTAPCTEKISFTDYRKDIDELINFLDGRREKTLEELRGRMSSAAEHLAFEEAARYRNQLRALQSLDTVCGLDDWEDLDIEPVSPESGIEDLKDRLSLSKPPRVIEGIDVSTISGRQAAGAKVTFVDGIPFKNGYRRYKIRTRVRDDYKMIAEITRRRFSRALREKEDLPDLFVVDGGAGHVNETAKVLRDLGIDIPCVGLAKKNEDIFLPNTRRPLKLASNDSALKMLQCVRDEAHRFARRYHHMMRSRPLTEQKKLNKK